MTPFFNREGRHIGGVGINGIIYDATGDPLARPDGGNALFDAQGNHVGFVRSGLVLDKQGFIRAFTKRGRKHLPAGSRPPTDNVAQVQPVEGIGFAEPEEEPERTTTKGWARSYDRFWDQYFVPYREAMNRAHA